MLCSQIRGVRVSWACPTLSGLEFAQVHSTRFRTPSPSKWPDASFHVSCSQACLQALTPVNCQSAEVATKVAEGWNPGIAILCARYFLLTAIITFSVTWAQYMSKSYRSKTQAFASLTFDRKRNSRWLTRDSISLWFDELRLRHGSTFYNCMLKDNYPDLVTCIQQILVAIWGGNTPKFGILITPFG